MGEAWERGYYVLYNQEFTIQCSLIPSFLHSLSVLVVGKVPVRSDKIELLKPQNEWCLCINKVEDCYSSTFELC